MNTCRTWSFTSADAWPAACANCWTACLLGLSGVCRRTISTWSAVTPREVGPPLPPLYEATHGGAYSENGIWCTPGLQSKPPRVVPWPMATLAIGALAAPPALPPAADPPPPALTPAAPPPAAPPAAAAPVAPASVAPPPAPAAPPDDSTPPV